MQLQENNPGAKYRLIPTISKKNQKETLQSIIAGDENSFSASAGTCNCERSFVSLWNSR